MAGANERRIGQRPDGIHSTDFLYPGKYKHDGPTFYEGQAPRGWRKGEHIPNLQQYGPEVLVNIFDAFTGLRWKIYPYEEGESSERIVSKDHVHDPESRAEQWKKQTPYLIFPKVEFKSGVDRDPRKSILALEELIKRLGGQSPTIQIGGKRYPLLGFILNSKTITFTGASPVFPDFVRTQMSAPYPEFITGLDTFVDTTDPQAYLDMLAGKNSSEGSLNSYRLVSRRVQGPPQI